MSRTLSSGILPLERGKNDVDDYYVPTGAIKDIHLGPVLPAFLSRNVVRVPVDDLGIAGINNARDDVGMFMRQTPRPIPR